MTKKELVLVLVLDEDEIGHIEQDHGNWAIVTYAKDGIRYTLAMTDDNYQVIDTIEVEMDDDE